MFAATKIALKVAILAATPLMTAAPTSHETSVPTTVTFIPAGSANTALPAVDPRTAGDGSVETVVGPPDVYILGEPSIYIGKVGKGQTQSQDHVSRIMNLGVPEKYRSADIMAAQPSARIFKTPDGSTVYSYGSPSDSRLSFNEHSLSPSMTNIPKSYEVYLLYRSDGTLIGPNGVVPLKPALPRTIPVTPKPDETMEALLAAPKSAGGAKP